MKNNNGGFKHLPLPTTPLPIGISLENKTLDSQYYFKKLNFYTIIL